MCAYIGFASLSHFYIKEKAPRDYRRALLFFILEHTAIAHSGQGDDYNNVYAYNLRSLVQWYKEC
jgi:hypothetical protein